MRDVHDSEDRLPPSYPRGPRRAASRLLVPLAGTAVLLLTTVPSSAAAGGAMPGGAADHAMAEESPARESPAYGHVEGGAVTADRSISAPPGGKPVAWSPAPVVSPSDTSADRSAGASPHPRTDPDSRDHARRDGDSPHERRFREAPASTPGSGGPLLPVLPLGAGLAFLGLGLGFLALRLRQR
ncbi:hypothetical protein [Streptomyces oceani]|uniref:Uncharacterized protein n=1 Tax=Streptomyces oceani TaxID=1075402 RepID=A0A1E7JWU1_9ACTN|nr:hypothetical protein [Streptomyces oceani]OEU96134.1 hypothetical protein AN216_22650 [Streptomyces oceani]